MRIENNQYGENVSVRVAHLSSLKRFRMPTLNEVYRKFGEVSEVAQLLETEIGTLLIQSGVAKENLLEEPNPERTTELFRRIKRQTLGQLLTKLNGLTPDLNDIEVLLSCALAARNRLSHSFYREHNFRRNSDDGRALMLNDLESIHSTLLKGYKAVMLLSGVNIEDDGPEQLPTLHLPIE